MVGHYLKAAIRNFRQAPLSTTVNILALAMGLACFVVAFAAGRYWERAEEQFPNAARTFVISTELTTPRGTQSAPQTPLAMAKYLPLDIPEFETVARLGARDVDDQGDMMVAAGDRKTTMASAYADPAFLEIFELAFVAGDGETALQAPGSVVLTEDAARRLFGTTDALGETVLIDNLVEATVTGVIAKPEGPTHINGGAAVGTRFEVLASMDVYARFWEEMTRSSFAQQEENWGGGYDFTTYAMLPESGALTRAEINLRLSRLAERRIPAEIRDVMPFNFTAKPVSDLMTDRLNLLLFRDAGTGVSVFTVLYLLGGLVLVVACLNYANLATAVAIQRAKEVGLRKTLGARRGQVIVQYLFEAGLLAVISLLLALAVIEAAVPLGRTAMGIDLNYVLFSGAGFWVFLLALILGVSLLAGSYPAFILSRTRPVEALASAGKRGGRGTVASLLVGVQFAAASFLLVTVMVMYMQNRELQRATLDRGTDPVVVINNMSFLTGVDRAELQAALERVPQVRSVTGNREQPWAMSINVTGFQSSPEAGGRTVEAYFERVGYEYFSTLGMTLLAGRVFEKERGEDVYLDHPVMADPSKETTIVVDADFARQMGFARPQLAVGEIVYIQGREQVAPGRIIGVVASRPSRFVGMGATSSVYLLTGVQPFVLARIASEDVPGAIEAIEETWERLAPGVPLGLTFTDELFAETYGVFQTVNRVFLGLAGFAFVIAAIGLFGMAVHVAGRRLREIGIRKTMGATRRQILAMLIRDFSKPVLVANIVAWPLAYLAVQVYLSIFVSRVALTPVPFLASLAVTMLIAWIAVGGQAWKAARANPASVLKYE